MSQMLDQMESSYVNSLSIVIHSLIADKTGEDILTQLDKAAPELQQHLNDENSFVGELVDFLNNSLLHTQVTIVQLQALFGQQIPQDLPSYFDIVYTKPLKEAGQPVAVIDEEAAMIQQLQ